MSHVANRWRPAAILTLVSAQTEKRLAAVSPESDQVF
jgi:hypothetical protein